tara:strand:- start:141 stop:1049 length:909 start_codon:yes stop_codon:yes gene_type:complete
VAVKQLKIAGVGEALWDVFRHSEQFGGAPANFVSHCCMLGERGFLVSAVGTDQRGRRAIERMTELGVNSKYCAIIDGVETGVSTVVLDSKKDAKYEIKENVAWDTVRYDPTLFPFFQSLDAICFGTLGQRTENAHLETMKMLTATKRECIKFFDLNFRQSFYSMKVISQSLIHSNIVKLNEEELKELSKLSLVNGSDEAIVGDLIKRFKLDLVALTLGERGSVLISPQEKHVYARRKIEVVDTVGAGDAFSAVILIGYSRGWGLSRLSRVANELGGFICTRPGATPNIPERFLEQMVQLESD